MNYLELTFQILGTLVVASPTLLLAVLGLTALANRPLSETGISRCTQAAVLLALLPAIGILAIMLATGIRYVPIELGNWVNLPEQDFHFHQG